MLPFKSFMIKPLCETEAVKIKFYTKSGAI